MSDTSDDDKDCFENKTTDTWDIASDDPFGEYNNGRDEKPWQRIPSIWILLLLALYLLLGYCTQLIEDYVPNALTDQDLPLDQSHLAVFSEQAAWYNLLDMVGDEPRVAGTRYHLLKTHHLKNMLDNVVAYATIPVKVDWQYASGNYLLNSAINSYHNLSNLIAVLEGESGYFNNGTIGSSVLFNCHYDSVPYALGASDNCMFCAIMLESLSRLSKRSLKLKLKHNVIFLFNGAEETVLQGSHGFLQHPWAKNIKAVVNLDSAGTNGKPSLFQVSDPRVLKAYKRAVGSPSAQSFGEALFASGLVPSDTDFRIWRDSGHIYGIDIAFTKWGQVYHTKYDTPAWILPGVIQGAGDSILALVTELGNTDLDSKIVPTSAVYYDYLNLFMVAYSLKVALLVDLLVVGLAALSVMYYVRYVGWRSSTMIRLMTAGLGRLFCALAGTVAVLVQALVVVNVSSLQLRYISQPWLVVPLYWLPYLVAAVVISHDYDAQSLRQNGLNRTIRSIQAMAATRLLLATVLFLMVWFPATATIRYIVSIPLCINSVAAIVSITIHRCIRLRAWYQLLLEVVLSLPATLFVFSLCLRADSLMLPIMGRTPTNIPDCIVAALNIALVTLAATNLSGMELLFSGRRLWRPAVVVSVVCIVMMLKHLNPYIPPASQRQSWFHAVVETKDYNGTSTDLVTGVVVTFQDAYSIKSALQALQHNGHSFEQLDVRGYCEQQVFCNLPLSRPSTAKAINESIFLTMDPPAPFSPQPAVRSSGWTCSGNNCTLSLSVTVAPHNLLTVWPVSGVNLTAWSFADQPRPFSIHKGRPVYTIVHTVATFSDHVPPLDFNLTFSMPEAVRAGRQELVEVSHHAHKTHHPADFTDQYRLLVHGTPSYFHLATTLSFRTNYVF